MALGRLLRQVALPIRPSQIPPPLRPTISTGVSTRKIDRDAGHGGLFERSAGQTLLAQIQAYRALFGYLPTAVMAGMLAVPGAWKATKFYANTLGAMPFYGYQQGRADSLRKLDPQPLFLTAPSGSRRTPFLVMSSAGIDAVWHGNAIGVIVARDSSGVPLAWVGVAADSVGVAWVDPGADLPSGSRIYQIGSLTFAQSDILHFQMPGTPGALRGLGVLEVQIETLRLAREQEDQAYAAAANSGVPTGILTVKDPDATTKEIAAAKAGWLEAQRLRTIAALGNNTEFQPIAWSPEASQMVESRQFTLTQVESAFELPVGWLGGGAKGGTMTYANRENDMANMLNTSWLAGGIPVFEQGLGMKLPTGQIVRADQDAMLRPDAKTRAEIHAIALGPQGWATRDEVRKQEDERPFGGEDGAGAAWKLPPAPAAPPAPIKATATVGQSIEGAAS